MPPAPLLMATFPLATPPGLTKMPKTLFAARQPRTMSTTMAAPEAFNLATLSMTVPSPTTMPGPPLLTELTRSTTVPSPIMRMPCPPIPLTVPFITRTFTGDAAVGCTAFTPMPAPPENVHRVGLGRHTFGPMIANPFRSSVTLSAVISTAEGALQSRLAGVLLGNYDRTAIFDRDIHQMLRKRFGEEVVFNTTIGRSVRMRDATV